MFYMIFSKESRRERCLCVNDNIADAKLVRSRLKGGIKMDIYELIKSRRTIRKFEQKAIEKDLLIKMTDAARVAPSGANLQPLKYVIVNSKEMTDKVFEYVRWAGYLAPDYNPKEDEKPTAYIAVYGDLSIKKQGFETDMGAAVENLILTALSSGIGACWMGAIDYEKITELLDAGEDLKLLCVVALGYPKEEPKETEMADGNVKYFLDSDNVLNVPKRSIDEVMVKIL